MPTNATGIAIYGDLEQGLKHVAQTRRIIYRLRENMKFQSVGVMSTQLRLDSTSYVYVYAMQGMTRAVIYAGYGAEGEFASNPTPTPDFWSGVVLGTEKLDVQYKPTAETARLHALRERYAPAPRLSVAVHTDVPEIDTPSDEPVSQYHKGKSTQWTGEMRVVVQAIEGYGKPSAPSIYDDASQETLDPTGRIELSDYERQIAVTGVQVRYGARFERTHGITTAADGRRWLVEISISRGVLAMPLPLFEATTLPLFRERVSEMQDSVALDLLDRFGGFPTGQIFPTRDDALEAAIRGGWVVRLRTHSDMSGVYEHRSYSPAMSWAFSDTGHDAVTTCWRYGADDIQRGSWWGVSLTIGNTVAITPNGGDVLREALATQGRGELHDWIMRKIDRLSIDQVRDLAREVSFSPPRAYRILDELVLAPLAASSARLSKRGEGYLWVPFFARHFPPIAYHHPFLKFCITHNPKPATNKPRPAGIINTIMWVAYIGQRLAWVRYFDDARTRPVQVDSTFEDCMYIGTFERTVSTDATEPHQTFFTSEFDDRKELAGSRQTHKIVGRSLGHLRVGVQDDLLNPSVGILIRSTTFLLTTTIDQVSAEDQRVGIVLPALDRCAYYYAQKDSTDGGPRMVGKTYAELTDPHNYDTWRNFPGFTGRFEGPLFYRAEHPDGCGPVDARTVRSSRWYYGPYPCSDIVDEGDWATTCDNADAMTYDVTWPGPTGVVTNTPRHAVLNAYLANASEVGSFRVVTDTKISPDEVDDSWFRTSPDPITGFQIVASAWHNAWGDAIGVVYQTTAGNPAPGEQLIFAYPNDGVMQDALDNGVSFTYIGRVP